MSKIRGQKRLSMIITIKKGPPLSPNLSLPGNIGVINKN